MRQNVAQPGMPGQDGRFYIENDWFNQGIPANVLRGPGVYIDSSYSFGAFHSRQEGALRLGKGSGCYDTSAFVTGEEATITIGEFTILNSTTLVCYSQITIGSHCMLAWGSVVTDTWLVPPSDSISLRRAILQKAAADPARALPAFARPAPVVLEDHCWIGFGAIVLPGVKVGRGAVVGSKTIVSEDVPPYAVVVGDPARIVRYLDPDDTEEAKAQAFARYLA